MVKDKKQTKYAIVIIVMVLTALVIGVIFSSREDRVTPNPPGTIGNTAGNLNNGGYFCEYNGKVYFSNAYDGGALYSMDVNETNFEKLNSSQICNILAGGDYLYYFQIRASGDMGLGSVRIPKSFNRCLLSGQKAVSLTRETVVTGQLVGDSLYLLIAGNEHPYFIKMQTDGSDRIELADYQINPACAVGDTIYYNGTQNDHYLYALNTVTDTPSELWAGNIWYPAVDGDYIYYLDVENNYRICRYSMSQQVIEVLTQDRADCFNVGYGYIYYQKNGDVPQLICMQTNGSNPVVVAEGTYTNLNLTSQYAYFQGYNEDYSLYHSPLGANYAQDFTGAMEAALREKEN